MKQQAGIGILLALTTAMCWGALPIAMKQVLEVMAPPTVVFYRFLMASIGLGTILAIRGKLPPLRLFRKPRWLVLLAIATGGLFGNFILFSSSLQYLSPTASQVIGQLSPVGMMVARLMPRPWVWDFCRELASSALKSKSLARLASSASKAMRSLICRISSASVLSAPR